MQRRDEEMEHGAGELRSLKHQIKVTENQMSEKQQFLENEQQNNHEKEKVVDVAERQVTIKCSIHANFYAHVYCLGIFFSIYFFTLFQYFVA